MGTVRLSMKLANSFRNQYLMWLHYIWYPIGAWHTNRWHLLDRACYMASPEVSIFLGSLQSRVPRWLQT